jgi:integrase
MPALFGVYRWGNKCGFFRYTGEGKMTETDKCFSLSPADRRRDRGSGSIFKPKFLDRKAGVKRECPHYRISYYRDGRRFIENTHSDRITVAKELLRKRLGAISLGEFVAPVNEKVLTEVLMEALFLDYGIRTHFDVGSSTDPDIERLKKKSDRRLKFLKGRWENHLKPFFGAIRAAKVSTDDINRYIEHRQQSANNATINRELALLKRAFNLATECTPKKLKTVPIFPRRLKENPPRQGFVSEAEYKRLMDNSAEHWMRAFLALAFTFGFRHSELLEMRVRQVNLLERTVNLRSLTTKNEEPRIIKMTDEVFMLLSRCIAGKKPLDPVFTRRNGNPVRDFRQAWKNLTLRAGLPGLMIHDFRRSAVRNMIRCGVPQVVAMRISGHKTAAVFNRYNIVDEADLSDAASRLERGRTFSPSMVQAGQESETVLRADRQLIN